MKPLALAVASLTVVVVVASPACVTVQPWERGQLARRAMTAGLGDQGLAGRYRAKLVETKTAHGTTAAAPGGGCGCSQ